MRVKSGVKLDGVHWALWYAAAVYDYIRQVNGLGEGTVTSGRDAGDSFGPARVKNSLHPAGRAVDLRTTDLPAGVPAALAGELRRMLGGAFDVVLESDHIHVEYVVADPVRV